MASFAASQQHSAAGFVAAQQPSRRAPLAPLPAQPRQAAPVAAAPLPASREAGRRAGAVARAAAGSDGPSPRASAWTAAHAGLQHVQSPAEAARVAKYKRIMLKVSGEALQGQLGFGMDPSVLESIAAEIAEAAKHGIQIAVVVGGGNYFRGASAWKGLERATADYVGMLATVMNALCLQAALENVGVTSRVQTAIEMREVAEPYIRRRAIRHLENGHVVIFGAGTGNPYFTTDTAAALRAAEVQAEVFLKATKVDGVYTMDPVKHPDKARRYERLSYRQVTDEGLQVMDETAVTLCKENNIPVIVFNAMEPNNILRAALGEAVGTVVSNFDSQLAAAAAPIHVAALADSSSDFE